MKREIYYTENDGGYYHTDRRCSHIADKVVTSELTSQTMKVVRCSDDAKRHECMDCQ